jgi:hypothetical protein
MRPHRKRYTGLPIAVSAIERSAPTRLLRGPRPEEFAMQATTRLFAEKAAAQRRSREYETRRFSSSWPSTRPGLSAHLNPWSEIIQQRPGIPEIGGIQAFRESTIDF